MTNDVISLLRQNHINCFLIKGFVIADCYPNWQHRTMGDSDIVVDDLELTRQVLLENGINNLTKTKDGEYKCYNQNMEIEFHDRLVYEEENNITTKTVSAFFNNFEEYVFDGRIDDSFHFLFVLNHLRKHLMNSGVGFRQFVDIATLIKNNRKINWDWVEIRLEEMELLPFTKVLFYCIEKWFGVVSPIQTEKMTEDEFEFSTHFIFCNGVFGFDNNENKGFYAVNNVRKSNFPKLMMIKAVLNYIFPSYKAMIAVDHYSFLRGKPLLLPIAWCDRFLRVFKNRKVKDGKIRIINSFVSKEYIDKREKLFTTWRVS